MQTILFLWPVTSMAIFAAAVIVIGAEGKPPISMRKIALLAAFWPMILTGFMVNFALWYLQRTRIRDAIRQDQFGQA